MSSGSAPHVDPVKSWNGYNEIINRVIHLNPIKIYKKTEWDYKIPLHLDVVDRYLRRMGDKTIPDEAPPSLESFYPPWVAGIDLPQSSCCGFFVSFTNKHK